MSVNFEQKCILGFKFGVDELKVVKTPAEYEIQNKYNTRTGEKVGEVKVLKKQEEFVYSLLDCESGDIFFLCNTIANRYSVDSIYETLDGAIEAVYVGVNIGQLKDYGRVELLETEISLFSLENTARALRQMFPELTRDINLYLFGDVG